MMASAETPNAATLSLTDVDLDQIAHKLLQRVRVAGSDCRPMPSAKSRPVAGAFPLRLTSEPVGDGQGGIGDEAELGNVIMEMFRDSYSDAGKETFTQAVQRCVVDELAVLELAMSNEDSLHEAARMLERIRHRILVAKWLDERMSEAASAATEGQS